MASRGGRVQPLVLAAGSGSRFGSDGRKLTAEVAGVPLIGHLLAALDGCAKSAMLDQPLVIVRPEARDLMALARTHRCRLITVASDGLSSSLRAGVSASAEAPAWMMLLADQPFSTVAHWRRLIACWQEGADAAFSDGGEGPQPPAIFDRSLKPQLLALSGDRGAAQLIGRLAEPPTVVTFRPGLWMRDVDTKGDLEQVSAEIRARRRGRSRGPAGAKEKGPGSAGSAP